MKILAALCFWGLCFASAQTGLGTFTSPDGVFQLKYSRQLVRCRLESSQEGYSGSWSPVDDCNSQAGVCDDVGSGAITIACFAYPKDRFKGKPTFSAAAFFVAEVGAAKTPKGCLQGSKNWLVEGTQSVRISSVEAKLYKISDAWLSGGQSGEIYRVFHMGKCYELGIQQAGTSVAAYDPGTIKEFTKGDQKEVDGRLKELLHSFRFLKCEKLVAD